MQDRNGKEIEAGMVVEISGAWAKADNGKFLVDHTYSDGGCWLKKLGAKGQLLKTSGNSWPLRCYSNDWKVCEKNRHAQRGECDYNGDLRPLGRASRQARK